MAHLARQLALLLGLVRHSQRIKIKRAPSLKQAQPRQSASTYKQRTYQKENHNKRKPHQLAPKGLVISAILVCLAASQPATDALRWQPQLIGGSGYSSSPSSSSSSAATGAANHRQRWFSIDGPAQTRRPIGRLMNRIQQTIGARNSIRVHNAFRDLAWRLLASLSMPTPVIYELRRQHFYSPEDDARNDLLHGRNTTKTIRTRRLAVISDQQESPAMGPNQDDLVPTKSIGERLQSRVEAALEHLVALSSRRTLFGRVVRLPSILPFKRQENKTSANKKVFSRLLVSRQQRNRRRRHKDPDRQMIFINGKQFYINDDGELKEWKESS